MIIVLDETYRPRVGDRFAGNEIRYFPPTIADLDAFRDLIADADVLGLRRVLRFHFDRETFAGARRLQFIHKSGSGADHFDTEALSDMGILVGLNTGFNAVSVAEHAVTMILVTLRRSNDFAAIIRSGGWGMSLPGEMPLLLSGKTVGLIGVGAIGARIARAMIGLDARVVAYHPDADRQMPPGVERMGLDAMLAAADVVSIQVPLTPATAGMIGRRELSLMRPTAVLVNTSRGGVVDEAAMVEALSAGRLRAAGLDVFAEEPLPADHPLRALPNVFATPHVAGVAQEIVERQAEGTLSNIELFLAGRRPERLVNPWILSDGRARARHLADA